MRGARQQQLKAVAKRLLGRDEPRPLNIQVEDPERDIAPYLNSIELRPLRFHVSPDLLTMQGAFGYGGWHPFVEALRQGINALEHFYARCVPANFHQFYGLPSGRPHDPLPAWELPWLWRETRSPPPGEAGLEADHGVSFFGPATPDKVAAEYRRLTTVADSVTRDGYRPDLFGDIEGHVIRAGGTSRIFVRGGKHRAAALTYLGWTRIPVRIRSWWPRVIDVRDSSDWPLVRSGRIAENDARAAFAQHVECDGRQQRERWSIF